jgi:N-acetyl-anhydromuramyl-L-alanine amidase AmpD
VDWWKSSAERVATSYIIAKSGLVLEVFSPEFWAYHLGKGSTTEDNKRSIGIEIVNEGGLVQKGKEFFFLDGQAKFKSEVFDNGSKFRGYRHFAKYTEEQYQAAASLCRMLCGRFGIPHDVISDYDFDKANFQHVGILSHRNLRSDKTDLSPAWDFDKFKGLFS